MYYIMQLTPWAEKTFLLVDLERSLKKLLKCPKLEVVYPVMEYMGRKKPSPYSEYIFVKVQPDVQYRDIDESEDFKGFLRAGKSLVTFSDEEVRAIHAACQVPEVFCVGEHVKATMGQLKGRSGEILSVEGEACTVDFKMGPNVLPAVISIKELKKIKRKRGA